MTVLFELRTIGRVPIFGNAHIGRLQVVLLLRQLVDLGQFLEIYLGKLLAIEHQGVPSSWPVLLFIVIRVRSCLVFDQIWEHESCVGLRRILVDDLLVGACHPEFSLLRQGSLNSTLVQQIRLAQFRNLLLIIYPLN